MAHDTQEQREISAAHWQAVLNANLTSLLQEKDTLQLEQRLDRISDDEAASLPHATVNATGTRPEDHRAHVRECWNAAFSITSGIPPEVLGGIFRILYEASKDTHWRDPYMIPLDSIQLSHVCSLWREIAVNSSPLWSGLSTEMSEECWNVHLARSRTSPLDMKCEWPINSKYTADIIAVYPRIQSWYFASESHDGALQKLHPMFSLESPHLHTLDIAGDNFLWDNVFNDYIVHRAPALRTLSVYRSMFPWGFDLPHVRSLRLTSHMYGYDQDEEDVPSLSHTFEDVLRTLHGARSLETLEIWGDVVFTAPSELPTPTISSTMRRLTLEGSVSRVCALLAAIKPSVSLQAQLVSEEYEIGVMPDARDGDPERLDDQSTVSARASDIICRHLSSRAPEGLPEFTVFHLVADDTCVALRLSFEVAPLKTLPSTSSMNRVDFWSRQVNNDSSPPYVDFRLKFKSGHQRHVESIGAKTLKLSRSITTAQVQCLQHLVLSALCWPVQEIERVFQYACRVESLTVYSTYHYAEPHAAALIVHLVCTSSRSAPAASDFDADATIGIDPEAIKGPRLLPALHTLRIVGVALDHIVQCDGRSSTLTEALTRGLEDRHQSGRTLQTLQLEGCGEIAERDVKIWAAWVPSVVIKG